MGKIDELTNEASAMQKPVSDIAERGGSGAIAQLIQQYCPDGVEYVKFVDYAFVQYGCPFDASHFTDDRTYIPLIRIRDVLSGKAGTYYTGEYSNEYIVKKGDILVGMDGNFNLGIWNDVDGLLNQRVCKLYTKDNNKLLDGFIKHYMGPVFRKIEESTAGGSVKHLSAKAINSIIIPLPPLPVQEAIVNILDRFAVYAAELQAELQARQQQYNYYRDTLLSFEGREDVQWKKLGEVCDNLDRKRKPITASNRIAGVIPYYGASGIVDYVKDYIFDGDYLLVSEDGANLLTRTYPIAFSIHGKTWVNNHAHILQFEERATRKYVEYYLNSIDLSLWISAGAQPKLTQDNLNKIPIPVPSLSEQQRIVNILDRFDTLTNDLSQGLPAEIEARQQQYEYYRDKLLTFKKKEA